MQLRKWISITLCSLMLCACAGKAAEHSSECPADMYPLHSEIKFETGDLESGTYTPAVDIKLAGNSGECIDAGVEIKDERITITRSGYYIVSGSLDNGMLIVHADKEDTVHIILAGAEIHSPASAAIYVRDAGNTIITAAENSKNRLSNGGEYTSIDDSDIDSVIFSKDDLSINGTGSIEIDAAAGHGIVSKDSLRISDVQLNISAANHGISANDDIGICSGDFHIESGKDGFHAENNDSEELGNVLILDGQFEIKSGGDGISAQNILEIDGGSFDIVSGGGYASAERRDEPPPPFNRNRTETEEDTISSKALKSGGDTYISGGKYQIDACNDAMHCDANLRISSGVFGITTGDDALHAEQNLAVYGGDISIESCYEGIEAYTIDIQEGNISLYSSDDGLNAAGGNDGSAMDFQRNDPFSNDPDAYIHISGGNIAIHCNGDGIDSNGEIRIIGGNIIVSGPTNGGNGSIDCGIGAYIDGGIFIATGSAQMAEHFDETSAQCSLAIASAGAEGSLISVLDASGKELYKHTAECSFDYLLLSLPDFQIGDSYSLIVDETETEFSFESNLYSDGTGSTFGRMGGKGFRKDNRNPVQSSQGMAPTNGIQFPKGVLPPDGAQFPDSMVPGDTSFQNKNRQ